MATFLSVQGYDPGPSQRPLTSGAISGILATIPAIPILIGFGSLKVEAQILGHSPVLTLAIGCLVMAIAGAVYARMFGRAANNVHGGWLFGMAFGFALWAAGAVLVLPIVSGGRLRRAPPRSGWSHRFSSGDWRRKSLCRSSTDRCTKDWRRRPAMRMSGRAPLPARIAPSASSARRRRTRSRSGAACPRARADPRGACSRRLSVRS